MRLRQAGKHADKNQNRVNHTTRTSTLDAGTSMGMCCNMMR